MSTLMQRVRGAKDATVVWHDFRLPWWGWVAAVACIVLDASLHSPFDIDPVILGELAIPSVFAGWVLALALLVETWRHVKGTWWAYVLLAGLLGTACAIVMAAGMDASTTVVVIINAIGEELSFRVALPLVIYAIVLRLVPHRFADHARLFAIVAAAAVFTIAPGHVEQMDGVWGWFPFFGIAIMWGLLVQATGAWLAAGLLHAVGNLLTWAQLGYTIDGPGIMALRLVGIAVLLSLMVTCTRTRPKKPAVSSAGEDDVEADAPECPQHLPVMREPKVA